MLEDDFVNRADGLRVAIVVLHELLDRKLGIVSVAHASGHLSLMIKEQSVFVSPGEFMQYKSNLPEEISSLKKDRRFVLLQKIFCNQLVWIVMPVMLFCNPPDCLDISESPGCRFKIRLKAVFGMVGF